jgi:hypothetical protein
MMMMMMTGIETMNNSNTVSPTTEDSMKHVTQETSITFPNINFMPTRPN